MNKKDTTYRMPEGFDPHSAIDAIRGLADAIHHTLLEGAGTDAAMSRGDKAGLNALTELLTTHVHELHDYLTEIENSTTLALPLSDADFEAAHVRHKQKDEVRETAAVYSIRPH